MNFKIEKRVGVRATSDAIWDVISDLPGWERWNPIETEVSGAIAFGGVLNLAERIEGLPERQVIARVADWQPNAQLVWTEKRGWLFNVIRYYEIEQLEPGSCIVANGFIFSGFRAEGFHDKHRKTIRSACESIGMALKDAAESR